MAKDDDGKKAEARAALAEAERAAAAGSESDCRAAMKRWMGFDPSIRQSAQSGSEGNPIQRAIEAKRGPELVLALIQEGAKPDWSAQGCFSPLGLAIEQGDELLAKMLLARGADPNLAGPEGVTPLMMAAALGREAMVELMASQAPKMGQKDSLGWTAFDWAVQSGNEAMAEKVARIQAEHADGEPFEACPDMHARALPASGARAAAAQARGAAADRPGQPASLEEACRLANMRALRALMGAGAKPDGAEGSMAAMACVESNFAAGLEALLAAGADPEGDAAGAGESPLGLAAALGRDECAKILLEAGADPSRAGAGGVPPLLAAARGKRSRVALQLIKAGADLEMADPEGRTKELWEDAADGFDSDAEALAKALCEEFGVAGEDAPWAGAPIAELLSAGGELDAQASGLNLDKANVEWAKSLLDSCWPGPAGREPTELDSEMFACVFRGKVRAMEEAVARGASLAVEALDSDGKSRIDALSVAVKKGSEALVASLLALGADPQGTRRARHKALCLAADAGNEKIVRILLAAGACPDGAVQGEPALHRAAGSGSAGCVQALLEAGASHWLRGRQGQPVLFSAKSVEVAAILAKAGARAATVCHGGAGVGAAMESASKEVRAAVEELARAQEASDIKEMIEGGLGAGGRDNADPGSEPQKKTGRRL